MKYFNKLLLIGTAITCFSCSGGDDNDNSKYLSLNIGSTNGVLIPKKTKSCEERNAGTTTEGTISGSYFELKNPVITWTGDLQSEISIIYIKFIVKSQNLGGEYSCVFSDTSLGILWSKVETSSLGVRSISKVWDGKLGVGAEASTAASTIVTSTSQLSSFLPESCNFICGGIDLQKAPKFVANGTWEMLAVQKKYSNPKASESQNLAAEPYEETPIKASGDFTIENALSNN